MFKNSLVLVVKRAEITGKDLVDKKEILEKLVRKILPKQ